MGSIPFWVQFHAYPKTYIRFKLRGLIINTVNDSETSTLKSLIFRNLINVYLDKTSLFFIKRISDQR